MMSKIKLSNLSKVFSYGLLTAILIVTSVTDITSALNTRPTDTEFFSGNDILFYDPNASPDVCPTSGSLVGGTNTEQAFNYFTSRGLTPEQAAGILGNLLKESGGSGDIDPGVEEYVANRHGTRGYGIAQWTNSPGSPRRQALEEAARAQGVPVNDLGFQLDYLWQEMEVRLTSQKAIRKGLGDRGDTELESMKKMTSVLDAAILFHDSFERSADSEQRVITHRGGAAQTVYDLYAGNAVTAGGTVAGCPTNFNGGDLIETVLAYAWPQYHRPPYINNKPEYAEAVRRAQSEGRYVGGLNNPGIDCGGFVTTLLVDSGFEPNYNHGGKLSSGAGATPTQERWVRNNWSTLGRGNAINTADLRPGDVAFSPGHTFVYVGNIDGFDSTIASASLSRNGRGWRSPMAGRESLVSSSVTWYGIR
jgi:hypothetical protein